MRKNMDEKRSQISCKTLGPRHRQCRRFGPLHPGDGVPSKTTWYDFDSAASMHDVPVISGCRGGRGDPGDSKGSNG